VSKNLFDSDEVDLFLPQIAALPLRDQRDTMERPFFSLAKKPRFKPIDYVSPDKKVRVHVTANSEYGMATIYDLDILIYCASVLIELKNRGVENIPQTLNVIPYDLLKILRRGTGGNAYLMLCNALDRLQSTTVKTSIRAGDNVETTFSWIDSWSQHVDHKGVVRGLRITLAKWFYDGVLEQGGVLAIDPDYFSLAGGRERWLYRVARKHAGGNGAAGFAISLPTLFLKSGAEGTLSKFKMAITAIVEQNELPGFTLSLIERPGAPAMLQMTKRGEVKDAIISEGARVVDAENVSKTRFRTNRRELVDGHKAPTPSPTELDNFTPFPAEGSIRYMKPFNAICAMNLPTPQADFDMVADRFRGFCKSKGISLSAPNIKQTFKTFCQNFKNPW